MLDIVPNVLIPASSAVGVLFAIFLYTRVSKISMGGGSVFRSQNGREYLLEEEQRGEDEVRPAGSGRERLGVGR